MNSKEKTSDIKESTQAPKISVVYKTNPEHLKEAIQSILNQTFTDFEFLILDDCPTDDREDVVKSFDDKRIKYFKNEKNLGISDSRNKLIDLAEGEYLAVFDHDDISLPERFEKQVKFLDEHPEIGVLGSTFDWLHGQKGRNLPENNKDIECFLMEGCALHHPAVMMRKSVLTDNNLLYEQNFSPAEDYLLFCKLIGKTKFYNAQKPVLLYRKHENQTSRRQAELMVEKVKQVQQFVRQEHPDIWKEVCENVPHVMRLKLFGIIPLGKFIQQGNERKGLLKYLPFIKSEAKYWRQK